MSQTKPNTGNEIMVLMDSEFPENRSPWRTRAGSFPDSSVRTDSLNTSLSRVPRTRTGRTLQNALHSKKVKVNPLRVLFRLIRVAAYLAVFYLGSLRYLWMRLTGAERLTEEDREIRDAIRFQELLERLGGVFIKVGQQLSQRPDFLSPVYCNRLERFLKDVGKEIPMADVEAVVKRQTGQTIAETFSYFNSEPIGKASVSCVYYARLETGEEVAVKVRRPDIEKSFTADLKALKLVLHLIEFLTIWRPGMTKNFRNELERVLTDELDFLQEARNQEIFRTYLKRHKKLNVTAPKVYYEYSSSELMVSEYVWAAYPMTMIIKAVEDNDECVLADLRRDRINPKKLAKQLVRSRFYSFHECPLFHGDPHPENILVRPDNEIVMIDFGACGVFSERDRNQMWHLNRYYASENVAGMVNMVIGMMEPIEPVRGLYQFKKDLIDEWWKGFYGIKSKHAEGWERSSIFLWSVYFKLVRENQIPLGRNVVRMIRATLLYDTVASRLYPKINVFREFEKYRDDFARRTRRRIQECAMRQILCGPDDSNYVRLQQLSRIGDGLIYKAQRFLEDPGFSFQAVAGKVYSAIRSFVRLAALCGALLISGAVLAGTYIIVTKPGWNPFRSQSGVIDAIRKPGWFLLSLAVFWFISSAVMVVAYGRRVYLRFGDLDD